MNVAVSHVFCSLLVHGQVEIVALSMPMYTYFVLMHTFLYLLHSLKIAVFAELPHSVLSLKKSKIDRISYRLCRPNDVLLMLTITVLLIYRIVMNFIISNKCEKMQKKIYKSS